MGMTRRRVSLEPLSIPEVDAHTLVGIAARTGFDYVSMVLHSPVPAMPADVIVRDRDLRRDTATAMRDQGIGLSTIECFNLTADANPEGFAAGLVCGHELGARNATAIVWENPDRADALAKLRRLCDMAREMSIRINVEFFAFCESIGSLDAAVSFVRDSGRENAGLQMDILHLIRSGGSIEDVRRLDPALISATQISDGPLILRKDEFATEAGTNRMVPGEGEFPIGAFLSAIPPEIVVGVEVPQIPLIGTVTPDDRARALRAAAGRFLEN